MTGRRERGPERSTRELQDRVPHTQEIRCAAAAPQGHSTFMQVDSKLSAIEIDFLSQAPGAISSLRDLECRSIKGHLEARLTPQIARAQGRMAMNPQA